MVGPVCWTYKVVIRLLRHNVLLVAAGMLSIGAMALELPEQRTVWACATPGGGDEDLWLVANGEASYVKLYEDRIWGTLDRVEGNLRWDVGDQARETYRYAVILDDALRATFYDFAAGPEQPQEFSYRCRLAL